jgi:hypothetical protein
MASYTPRRRPTGTDGISVPQTNGLFYPGTPVEPDLDRRFIKVVGFCVPRRWATPETMDVDGFVAEIEGIVRTSGLVAYDGQVITSLRPVEEWEEYFEPGPVPERTSQDDAIGDPNSAHSSALSSHTRWPMTRTLSPIPASR